MVKRVASSFSSLCKKNFLLLVVTTIGVSFAGFFVVHAQSVDALSLNKTKVEFYGYAGQVINADVELKNNSKKSTQSSYYNSSMSVSRTITGTISSWIQVPKYLSVYSGSNERVSYTITIPQDAKSGDYESTITFRGDSGASVALKVILHIGGGADIRSFDVGMPLSLDFNGFEKQKYLDDLYAYVEETGSTIAYTKLKLLEKKYNLKGSSRVARDGDYYYYGYRSLRPHDYSLLDAIYGPLGSTLIGDADIGEEIDFMTGARAVDETLQLGSMYSRTPIQGDRTIPISSVQDLDVKSHPWDDMIAKHTRAETSDIFKLVPEDDFVVHFNKMSDMSNLEAALKEMLAFGDYFFDISHMLSVRQTVVKRLGIENLEQFEALVGEVAFVSEDLSFVPGTNYALILKLDSGSKKVVDLLASEKSVHGEVGDYYVIASSQALFDKIVGAQSGSVSAMSNAKDFVYASSILESDRDGMVYLSEKFILKLVSPEYRINADRRNTVLQKLESLQYMVFAYQNITGTWPNNFQQMATEGYLDESVLDEYVDYAIGGDGRVSHKDWGTLYNVVPVDDVKIVSVSRGEKDRYDNFREGYEEYWREFFDPVGIAMKVSDQLYFHTIILPLIDESGYNSAKDFAGVGGKPFDGITNPPRDIPMLFMVHMNFDEFLIRMAESLFGAQGRGKIAAVQSNLNNLRAQAELSYDNSGNSYTSVCTDSTVVRGLKNAEGYASTSAVCKDSTESYAISIEVAKGSGVYYCVDSTGVANFYSNDVTTTACPRTQLDRTEAYKKIEEADAVNASSTLEEKKKLVNEELNEEFKEIFDEPFDFFGIIGDELQVGAGTSTAYELENIADVDMFVGIKLQDQKRAEEFINTVYKAFAKEFSDEREFSFFSISTDRPLKNEYNGVEYYMIPAGFANLFYLFSDNGYVYFTVSQKAINSLIAGITDTSGKNELSAIQKRSLDYIGKEHSLFFIADLTQYDVYKKELLDKMLEPSYAIKSHAEAVRAYVADVQLLQRSLSKQVSPTDFSEAETYIVNVPKTFLGLPIEITANDILFGAEKHPYGDIDFGSSRSYYSYDDSDEEDTNYSVTFDELFSEEDKQKILASWNAFTGFSIGLTFTEDGLDTKVAINNPLIEYKGSLKDTFAWLDVPLLWYVTGGGVLIVISVIGGLFAIRRRRKLPVPSGSVSDTSLETAPSQPVVEAQTSKIVSDNAVSAVGSPVATPQSIPQPIPNKELIEYIKTVSGQGVSRENIRAKLLQGGWNEADVQHAFTYLDTRS